MAMRNGPPSGIARCGQCFKSWTIFKEWEIRSQQAPTENMLRLSAAACDSIGIVLNAFSRRTPNVYPVDYPHIILAFHDMLDALHYVQQEVVAGDLCVNGQDAVGRITSALESCMDLAKGAIHKAQSGNLPYQSPNIHKIHTIITQMEDFISDWHDPSAGLNCCKPPVCTPMKYILLPPWSRLGYRRPREYYDKGCKTRHSQKQDRNQSDVNYEEAQREITELRTIIDMIQAWPAESRVSQRKCDLRTDLVVVSWSAQWVQSKNCCCVKVQLQIPHDLMAPPAFSFMLSFGSTLVAGDVEMLDPKYFLHGYVFTAPIPPLVMSSISSRLVELRLLVDSGSSSTNSGTTIILGGLNRSDVSDDREFSESSKYRPPSGSDNFSNLNKHQKETLHAGGHNKPPSGQPQKQPLLRTWIADVKGNITHSQAPAVINGECFLCTKCCERLRKQAQSTSRRAGALFNSDGACFDQDIVNRISRYVATGDERCICQRCSSRLKREAKLKKCFISILFDVESASESTRPPRDRSYERTRPRRSDNMPPATSATPPSFSRRSGKSGTLQVDGIFEDKIPKQGKAKVYPSKAEADAFRLFNIVKSNPNRNLATVTGMRTTRLAC